VEQALIEAHDLSFSYGQRTRALSDLNFSLPGGATGLLGPNGAGKTTLVRIIMGLLHVPESCLLVRGMDAMKESRTLKSRIGLVPEKDVMIPQISAVQYVAYAGRLAGLRTNAAMDRAHMVLHFVGLGGDRYRKIDGYSKGMRQRLKLAQALVHDPDFLILDEPTDGMDPKGRDEMLELLHNLATIHGKHLLLCTHLLDDVKRVCTRVLVLSQGKMMGIVDIDIQGEDTDLYALSMAGNIEPFVTMLREKGLRVDVDNDGDGQIALGRGGGDRLVAMAVENDVQILKLIPVRESLEQLFTRLVQKEQ